MWGVEYPLPFSPLVVSACCLSLLLFRRDLANLLRHRYRQWSPCGGLPLSTHRTVTTEDDGSETFSGTGTERQRTVTIRCDIGSGVGTCKCDRPERWRGRCRCPHHRSGRIRVRCRNGDTTNGNASEPNRGGLALNRECRGRCQHSHRLPQMQRRQRQRWHRLRPR